MIYETGLCSNLTRLKALKVLFAFFLNGKSAKLEIWHVLEKAQQAFNMEMNVSKSTDRSRLQIIAYLFNLTEFLQLATIHGPKNPDNISNMQIL